MSSSDDELRPVSLARFVAYFLRLGTFGFGGPIALAGYMQRDLVERERWLRKQDFVAGLALAQLAPGPLAVLTYVKRVPEPLVIVAAGLVGLALAA